mgnify:CR=1 FL=1
MAPALFHLLYAGVPCALGANVLLMRVDVGPGRATLEDVQRAWLPLVEQSDQIADSITLTLLERDAAVYDQVGPDLRTDVRESTRVHIRRGLEVLTGRRPAGGSSAAQARMIRSCASWYRSLRVAGFIP